MIRLLVTVPWGDRAGGAEQMLWLFLRHVDRSKISPLVVFLQDGPFQHQVASLGIDTFVIPSGRLRNVRQAARAVYELRKAIRASRPDLVLNWSPKTQLYGASAAAAAGIGNRVLWWQHGIPGGHWLDRVATALPSLAIGCSSICASHAQDRIRPRRPTFFVHPGIEVEPVDRASKMQVREELRVSQDALVIGTVGRLEPSKRQHALFGAMAQLRTKGHDVHGIVIGGEAFGLSVGYEAYLKRIARQLGLSEAVTFTGQVEDGAKLVPAFDVFLSPSRSESFGLGLLEAMRAGVPPVTFDRGGQREIIESGRSGVLVRERSDEALTHAVETLLIDPELRTRLGRAARRRFESYFTAERMTRQIEERLEELCP
jgi:glycosyltransferase involved in cell wall biosynthesis